MRRFREKPMTAFLWWWLPCLLAVGLRNGGSEAAAIAVAIAAVAFAWWFYNPPAPKPRSAQMPDGRIRGYPAVLVPGEIILTPEGARQLGLTADARRMERERRK